jgi:FkbM family methyltransferase
MDFVTVDIADLYLAYFPDDSTLRHMLEDPRARVVTEDDIRPKTIVPIDVEVLWHSPGQSCFNLFFTNLWRNDLDFVYLDIGANVGILTIALGIFFKRCGRTNRILSFEPGRAFECLKRGVRLNGLEDLCSCYQLAVGDHTRRVAFHSLEGNSIGSTIQIPAATGVSVKVDFVDCVRLDDFVREHDISSNLICKIDTEGADLQVIEGMAECIATRFVLMFFEFTPGLIDTYADPTARLGELCGEFVLLEKIETGFRPIPSASRDVAAFVQRIRSSPKGYTDIIALPKGLPRLRELEQKLLDASM